MGISFDPFHTDWARAQLPGQQQQTRDAATKALEVGLLTQEEFTGLTDGSIGASDEFVTPDLLTCIKDPASSERCKRAPGVTGEARTQILRDLYDAAVTQRNTELWAQPMSNPEKREVVWGQLTRGLGDWL
jgi:hypothetical protein